MYLSRLVALGKSKSLVFSGNLGICTPSAEVGMRLTPQKLQMSYCTISGLFLRVYLWFVAQNSSHAREMAQVKLLVVVVDLDTENINHGI
jgi:hypothetical protein